MRERRLSRGERVIPLRAKVFDTLCVLVERAGKLVTKQELLDAVWPDSVVEENNIIPHDVGAAQGAWRERYRTAVRRDRAARRLPLRRDDRARERVDGAACRATDAGAAGYPLLHHERRRPPGVRQHRQRAAAGESVELADPSRFRVGQSLWRHWWAELSAHHRVIRYDERGNGMSQRDVSNVSSETWVRDLETVVDAAGLDRFALLGISRGASIAIDYTVRHPERVSRLVLYGAIRDGLEPHGNSCTDRGKARAHQPHTAAGGA